MADPTDYFVDPLNGDDGTGDGSSGTPWATVQNALDTITRDATNGDQINVRDTADDVLSSALSLATYGTPSASAPLIIRGYTSSADDGGIGGISGDGSVGIFASTYNSLHIIDMHLHNTGANDVLQLGNDCFVARCEIDNSTVRGIDCGRDCKIISCHIHNIAQQGVFLNVVCTVAFCTFANGTNDFNFAINADAPACYILHNVIDIDGSTSGIRIRSADHDQIAIGNSIYSNGGTGTGVVLESGNLQSIIISNIVEGFSGAGGIGISLAGGDVWLYGHNAFYDNETNLSSSADIFLDLSGQDQALGASPFTDAANGDFTVDTSVQALAYPTANYPGLAVRSYLDIGALQREEAGGGETLHLPTLRGRNSLLRR